MEDSDEPPTERVFNQLVNHEFVNLNAPGDLELVLMWPNLREGILAVFNPSTCKTSEDPPWPFVYRYEKEESGGRYSEIALTYLLNPVKLSKKGRTIITRTEEYDSWGCEDPSLSVLDGVSYVTYVGWDKLSARICLAITEDFKDIQKFGVIGPQILMEEAADILPSEIYKRVLEEYMKAVMEKSVRDMKKAYLWDKDPVLDFDFFNREWVFGHRIDPFIHIARAKSLDEFKRKDYWMYHVRNLDNYRIDADPKEPWESKKVGLGCFTQIGDKKVGLYHGVDDELTYSGSAAEVDPRSYKFVSRLRDPFLRPDKPIHNFEFLDNGQVKMKKVVFPRGSIVDEESRRLYAYHGIGDGIIGVKSTDIDWMYRELNNPHNRILQGVS